MSATSTRLRFENIDGLIDRDARHRLRICFMSLGIGLLMPPGPDGRPTAVYLVDMQAVCSACGKEAQHRYFLSTPFHSLTLRRLDMLFDSAPAAIEGACEQCDATLQAADVERWSMQYSPGDGEGLLIGLMRRGAEPQWRALPHDHLDVQGQPVWAWTRDDISSIAMESLTEREFYEKFRRYMNPKSALRQMILASKDRRHLAPSNADFSESGACQLIASPGMEFWVGPADRVEQAIRSHPHRAVHAILVEDGRCAEGYPDAPSRWLSDISSYLVGQSVVAFGDSVVADASLRRHFSRFPIDLHFDDEGETLRVIAGDGSEDLSVLEFHPVEITREALRTGAAPGDVARAEIDRALTLLDFTTST